MLTLLKPTHHQIRAFLTALAETPFSYSNAGVSRGEKPDSERVCRLQVDRHRVLLGHGAATFELAKQAVRQWKMFPLAMAELFWPDRPIAVGTVVAVLFRAGLFWSLNPCRIVYLIDEPASLPASGVARFGFAYGTLPGHLESGEERFVVEWNRADDAVHYDLQAHSRAQSWLAWLGYPIVRWQQARFRRLSGLAMQEGVEKVGGQCN